MSAPIFDQVKHIIWEQLTILWNAKPDDGRNDPPFRPSLNEIFGVDLPLDPSTGVRLNGNLLRGMSTTKRERAAGISSPEGNLFIIDEASGFPTEIYEAFLGNLAGGGKILGITNPTVTSGWLFELFRQRTPGWQLLTLNSENSPNAVAGQVVLRGVARRDYIQMIREQCAPGSTAGREYAPTKDGDPWAEHPFYMVRILGRFPPQGANAIIGITLIDKATMSWRGDAEPEPGELVIGVDVAESGDDLTVLQPVRGYYAYEPIEMRKAEGDEVAARIVQLARQLRISDEAVRINLDGIGVGKGPYNALKFSEAVQQGWIRVCSLNVGMAADVDSGSEFEDYANLRTQLWYGCADWLKKGGKLPKHDRLIAELLAANSYPNSRGQLRMEEKKLMKIALGGRSPDYADALCLATYRGKRGAWIEFSYERVPDPRHPEPPADWGSLGGGRGSDGGRGDGGAGGKFGCF